MLECLQYVLLSLMCALGITEGAIVGVESYRQSRRPRQTVTWSAQVGTELAQAFEKAWRDHFTRKVDKISKKLKEKNRYSIEYEQEEKEIRTKIDQYDISMDFKELDHLIDNWGDKVYKNL